MVTNSWFEMLLQKASSSFVWVISIALDHEVACVAESQSGVQLLSSLEGLRQDFFDL
jgi:hypothetical protein